MPIGNIAQAIKLIQPNINTKQSYTYYFATTIPSYQSGYTVSYSTSPTTPGSYTLNPGHFVNLTSSSESAFASSLTAIDRIAGVSFSYLDSPSADIVVSGLSVALYDHSGSSPGQVLAFAHYPINSNGSFASDLWIAQGGMADVAALQRSVQHELLHTVGLRDVTPLGGSPIYTGDEDSGRYTIMSYELHPTEARRVTELQIYDIAALQAIYGRDDTYNSGNTSINQFVETSGPHSGKDRIYSIWDGGGEDTINVSGLAQAALVDLRPGYFSSIGPQSDVQFTGGATPAVTAAGTLNISIAYGAYIENAEGTGAGDLIIGNILTNKLEGGDGADVIYAEGADSIHEAGDGGYDRVTSVGATKTEAPPTSVQSFISNPSSQIDHLLGGAGDDYLRGGRGSDLLEGGADDDHIIGGGGDDEIWGGDKDSDQGVTDGTDTVTYAASTAGVVIHFNGAGTDTEVRVEDGQGGADTLHSIEKIVATSRTDYLYYNGEIPDGYVLEIDMGSDAGDVVANAQGASTSIRMNIDVQGTGTLKGDGPGTIHLLNATTQIIGSAYDDEITDLAEHDGLKRIDGGWGNDVITVDGSDATIIGGAGDDTVTGGDGNDVLRGDGDLMQDGGSDVIHGGGGSDFLTARADALNGGDELFGDEGDDYLLVAGFSAAQSLVSGGTGNDVIDARGSWVTMTFGAGDGHDMILSDRELGSQAEAYDGVALIDMTTISKSEVSIIWNPVHFIGKTEWNPEGGPLPAWNVSLQGDLVIRIDATGDTILFKNIVGSLNYFENDPGEGLPDLNAYWFAEIAEPLGWVQFADGFLQSWEVGGPNDPVALTIGSVAAYATALDDYNSAIAPDPLDNEGTPSDDDLRGSRGDDAIAGGDGDDGFHESGGDDAIDGGAGTDTLYLFGAGYRYSFTRDPETGAVTVEDEAGQGKLTILRVEQVYFATDNETWLLDDLVGYWGTPDDDALIEGNDHDNLIYGLAGDDTLHGLGGDDLLDGGPGADAMAGGAGDDAYIVDSGGDQVIEGAGSGANDIVFASVNYTLAAGQEVETLSALDWSSTASLDLTGNEIANTLFGNAGTNLLDGGAGTDTAAFAGALAFSDTLAGWVVGSVEGNDFLQNVEIAVDGSGQRNLLVGSTGFAGIQAAFDSAEIGDIVRLASGTYAGSWTYDDAGLVVIAQPNARINGTFTTAGSDGITIFGANLADTITTGAGNDRLHGGAGTDTMAGGAGDDWYFVDGGDTVVEGASEGTGDRAFAGTSYTLSAGAHVEIMSTTSHAGTAAIDLGGNELNNLIYGNAGDNRIDGHGGGDVMVGFGGNDWYYVDHAGDRVVEGASEGTGDRVFASASYTLNAGAHIEIMSTSFHAGTAAIDLGGNELGNLIYGNAGSNVLDGKGGSDTLIGNGGADTFAFTTALGANNVDILAGFGADDTIALDDAVFAGLGLGALDPNAFVIGTAAQDADDRIVYDQATGRLSYDADGNGAGAAVQFATLAGAPIISASDFQVI